MKKYLLLLTLVCLLGNGVQAQTYISNQNDETITEVIDFTSLTEGNTDGWRWSNNGDMQFVELQGKNYLSDIDRHFRIGVDNTQGWRIGSSNYHGGTSYFQLAQYEGNWITTVLSILNLKIGDKVKIYAVNNPVVISHNTDRTLDGNLELGQEDVELTVVNNSNLDKIDLLLENGYKGIRKVEITTKKKTSNFDYDPGFEVYDMWSTRATSVDNDDNPIISVTQTTNAGFQLNNSDAKFITLSGYKETLNDRIAVSGSDWKAHYGLMSTKTSGWSYFSVCNLREGDRVVLYYTGEAPIFSSNGNGDYNGSAAFRDTWNDGVLNTDYTLDDEKDQIIKAGDAVTAMHSRPENNISRAEGRDNRSVWLYTSYAYTVMENGHLDFAIKNDGLSRIVKVKVYSDHQAMMVDDTDEEHFTYKSYFNITGELQAKEHIMPGGLEIHVGNTDSNATDQNAVVVASNEGPVSYVKAVDGYKIPGITKSGDNININFNLHNVTAGQDVATSNIPKTGTFYKFMPEQDGEITVKFLARSMNYYRYDIPGDGIYYADNTSSGPWYAEWDRPNEQTRDFGCPYYLVTAKIENGVEKVESIQKIDNDINAIKNGDIKEFTINNAQEGMIYYLYGGWRDVDTNNNNTVIEGITQSDWTQWGYNGHSDNVKSACGVAELLSVKFSPKNGVFPLSKWVKNGTEAVDIAHPAIDPDDLQTEEYEMATVKNFTTADITVKKMSGNIIECHPYIYRENTSDEKGKLRIDGIKFAEGKNPGGTILMKLGDPARRSTPVFALTIAYSTDPKYDEQQGSGIRGHVWDYSTYSLNGLTWDTTNGKPTPTNEVFTSNDTKYAVVTDYGTSQTNDLLKTELGHGDWLENYNLIYNGVNYDKIFLNKYDVEGDNADVYWDTEGMVLKASANQSGMNNEYGQTVSHSESKDPDRYIGILEGGEFRIPWLMKNDRVIIWMGTGKGRFADEVKLNIRNAYDAMHKPISESDEYIVGGSHWDGEKGDPYYRGCYHFFATGNPNDATKPADMVFKMKEGSLCKIYKIQIYRGDRIITNDLVPVDDSPLYLLTEKGSEETIEGTYSIQYRGKGESISEPEMAGMTGNLAASDATLASLNDENTSVKFTTSTLKDKFGVFNMRLNDMERNNKYVADFADRNFPVDYYEKMPHPYTWDFTDVNRFNTTYLASENSKYSADDLNIWDAEKNFTWKRNDELLFVPGGQIYADAQMIAEAAGIQFTPVNMGNGTIKATNDGLRIEGGDLNENDVNALSIENITGGSYDIGSTEQMAIWEKPDGSSERTGWKLTIPNLPNLTAVYIRVQTIEGKDPKLTFDFSRGGVGSWSFFKKTINNNDGTKDIIVGLSPSLGGSDMAYNIFLNNVIVKKIATSKDIKPAFGKTGYQTESRHREIDHRLTGFFTGETIEAYYGTLGKNDKNEQVVVLHPVNIMDKADPDYTGDGITGDEDAEVNWRNSEDIAGKGCILYHVNGTEAADGKIDRTLSILDGGFHLFVPDMHDMDVTTGEDDLGGPDDISDNILWARFYNADVWSWGTRVDKTVPGLAEKNSDGSINYALSAKHYNRQEQLDKGNGYDVGFYHVDENGAEIGTHASYVRMGSGSTQQSKIFFTFDDGFFYEDHGIATQIDDASHLIDNGQLTTDHADWYNLNGQKLSGKPSANGLYIKNGKKVIIK